MNQQTKLNVGFVVICPDPNAGLVRSTLSSISGNYPDIPAIAVVPENAKAETVAEMRSMCPVSSGKLSLASLINAGLEKISTDWAVVIHQGSLLNKGVLFRLCRPITEETDVIYAIIPAYDRFGRIVDPRMEFAKAVLNGLMLHKSSIKKVGRFSDNPIEISKFFWMLDAMDKGFKFKGVLGAKII